MIDPPRPPIEVAPAAFQTHMPRGVVTSPDGRTIVFETMGKLWLKPASGGTARRLTSATTEMEAYPTWSRDGKTIAYVHWTDKGLGHIRTVGANGGVPKIVTAQPGHYARPRFSPDGKTVVFEKQEGGGLTSPSLRPTRNLPDYDRGW